MPQIQAPYICIKRPLITVYPLYLENNMKKIHQTLQISLFFIISTLLLTACGGGADSESDDMTLSGTAATGAPIVGSIQVTGSAGNKATVSIDASGNYSIDVSGLSSPFIISAIADDQTQATQYSIAFAANQTVNITPLTTLTLFNASAKQDLENLETNWATLFSGITQQQIEDAAIIIKANFASLLSSEGLDPVAFDIFGSTFNADGSGFDAILDLLTVIFDFINGSFTVDVDGQPAFSFDPNIDTSGFGGSGNVDLGSLTFSGAAATDLGFTTFTPQTNETATINTAGSTSSTLVWEKVEGSKRYKLSIVITDLNNGNPPSTTVTFDVFTVGESTQTHIWSTVAAPPVTIGFDDVAFNFVSLNGGMSGSAEFTILTINGVLNRDRTGL
jgi:hypothetical protein